MQTQTLEGISRRTHRHPVLISTFDNNCRDLHSSKVAMTTSMIQHTKTKWNFIFRRKTNKTKQNTAISWFDLCVNLSFNWLWNPDMIYMSIARWYLNFFKHTFLWTGKNCVVFDIDTLMCRTLFEEYWPFSAISTVLLNDGNIAVRHAGAGIHASVYCTCSTQTGFLTVKDVPSKNINPVIKSA